MAKNELYHHGTKGQKWGIRKYQNPDGTLTEEGKKRYGSKKVMGVYEKTESASNKQRIQSAERQEAAKKAVKDFGGKTAAIEETKQAAKSTITRNRIKAAIFGGLPALAGSYAFGIAADSLGGLLLGSLPGAIIASGAYFANRNIRRNRDLMKSYINDLQIDKSKIHVD